MVSSSFAKGRKNLKNLVHRIQSALLNSCPEGPVSARYRDAFFYLLAEKWLIAEGVSEASTLLHLLGFPAEEGCKNTVSELLSESLYKDLLWPESGGLATEDSPPLETFGWLYQYWNGADRDAVTWAISRVGQDGLHNESITLATQIYTERYMAEFLVQQVLLNVDGRDLTTWSVIDPACGSGHILLAVCELFGNRLGESLISWVLAGNLQGVDIDTTAVNITRLVVLLYLMKVGVAREALVPLTKALAQSIRTVPAPLGTLCRNSSVLKEGSYDVVITNPPYIGRRKLHPDLREFLSQFYTTTSGDLACAFTIRCIELLKPGGHLALVSNDKWIRLRAYYGLRWSTLDIPGIFSHLTVQSLVELGSRAFHREADLHDGVGAALLHAINTSGDGDCTFRYVNLTDPKDYEQKVSLLRDESVVGIELQHQSFSSPSVGRLLLQAAVPEIATPDRWTVLGKSAAVVVGIQTNEDSKYVRPQWLLPKEAPGWVVHQRGGGVQKWFGLNRWMLNLEGVRNSLRSSARGPFPVEEWFERDGWTYSWFASGTLALRRKEKGWSFGRAAASGVFLDDLRIIGFLNSSVGSKLASKLSGKVQMPEGVVREVPIPKDLAVIPMDVINRLITIQELLVAQDPREVTFSPKRLISPSERIELEKQYHEATLRLELAAREAASGEVSKRDLPDSFKGSLGSRGGTKEEMCEIIQRIGAKKNVRPELLVRSILGELQTFHAEPVELLRDLFENEESVQRVVWNSYFYEKLHHGLLSNVGHQWRADEHHFQREYRSITKDEMQQLAGEICHQLREKEKILPTVASELEACCRNLIPKKLAEYHESIFSGYPLLQFTDEGVSHIFSL